MTVEKARLVQKLTSPKHTFNQFKSWAAVKTSFFELMQRKFSQRVSRRKFLLGSVVTGGGIIAAEIASKSLLAKAVTPGIVTSDKIRWQYPTVLPAAISQIRVQ